MHFRARQRPRLSPEAERDGARGGDETGRDIQLRSVRAKSDVAGEMKVGS